MSGSFVEINLERDTVIRGCKYMIVRRIEVFAYGMEIAFAETVLRAVEIKLNYLINRSVVFVFTFHFL